MTSRLDLHRYRFGYTSSSVSVCITMAALMLDAPRSGPGRLALFASVLLSVMLLTRSAEAAPPTDPVEALLATLSNEQKVGQLLLAGFPGARSRWRRRRDWRA